MEKQLIGEGLEHKVYASIDPAWVLKRPKLQKLVSVGIFNKNILSSVLYDIEFMKEKCLKTGIMFPETRVFPFGNGYVLAQRRVVADNSMSQKEIIDFLNSAADKYMLHRFIGQPSNFLTNHGNLYMVDLTMGVIHVPQRFLSYDLQDKLKSIVARPFKRIRT